MPKPLSGELNLSAQAQQSEFVHLLEFLFSTGMLRMTTGAVDLTTDPYAVRIDGSANSYLIRNPVAAPWPTTELTIEAWVRRDGGDSQVFRAIATYARPTVEFNEIQFAVNYSTGAVILAINNTQVSSASGSVPADGQYHHVLATWNSSGGVWFIYVDGVQKGTGTALQSAYSIVGGGALVIGQEQDSLGGTFDGTQAWLGELDDVRVYRRVLTSAEAAEHFNRRFTNEQKLVAKWKFDALAQQELDNPGLESGSTGWALVTGVTIVNDAPNARTGSWVMRYATDGVGGPNVINNKHLKVKPGDQVYMECWVRSPTGGGTMSLAVRWRDAAGVQVGVREQVTGLVGSATGPVASYTKLSGITNGAPAGAVYAVFDIGENNVDNQATPWFIDDCIMSISPGKDTGPIGNHLVPVGILNNPSGDGLKRTWTAVGGLLRFGGVEEAGDPRGQGLDVQLSGVTQTAIAILLGGTTYRGRRMRIWRAHLDGTTGMVVDEPLMLFEGLQLSPYEIQEDRDSRDGGTVTVKTRIRGRLGVERIKGIWANLTSHQHLFPGDTFFQHVAQLANSRVFWGVPTPRSTGGGGGGGFTDNRGPGDGTQFEQ